MPKDLPKDLPQDLPGDLPKDLPEDSPGGSGSQKKIRKRSDLSASGARKKHNRFSARLTEDKREALLGDRRVQNTQVICQMYLQGYTFNEIAKNVDLHWAIVRDVVDESRKIWMERHNRTLSELVSEQLARIDRVESRAWESYELSRKNYLEQQDSSGSSDKGTFSSTKRTKRKQVGSSEFLSIILNCVKQRTELLGLAKRDEDDSLRTGSMLVVVNSPDEARAIADYQEFQKMVDGEVVRQE